MNPYHMLIIDGNIGTSSEFNDINAIKSRFFNGGSQRNGELSRHIPMIVNDSGIFNILINDPRAELVDFIVNGEVQDCLKLKVEESKEYVSFASGRCERKIDNYYWFLYTGGNIAKSDEVTIKIYSRDGEQDITSTIYLSKDDNKELRDRITAGYLNDMVINVAAGVNLINVYFYNTVNMIAEAVLYRVIKCDGDNDTCKKLRIKSSQLSSFVVFNELARGDYIVEVKYTLRDVAVKTEYDVTVV